MKRAIQRATVLAASLLLAGVGMSAVSAAKPGGVTEPSSSQVFDFDAGAPCAFPVHVAPVIDDLMVTTWPEKPNGDVVQVYSGRVVSVVTNVTSGESLRFDTSGEVRAVFHADGTLDAKYGAPSLLFNLAEEGGRDGLWIMVHGSASEAYDSDFNLVAQRLPGKGALIDLCQVLK